MPLPRFTTDTSNAPPTRLEPLHAPAFHAYKAEPSPTNASTLLKSLKPVIDAGVTAFGGKAPSPMTKSRAKRLTLDAVSSYDPMQASLKTHVTNHLQGLQRYAAKQTQMIAVPERVAMERQHLDAATEELRDTLGREPSSLELADHTGLSLKRQAYIRQYNPGFSEGQAEAGMLDDSEGSSPAVEQASPLKQRIMFIYHDLDPVNQTIAEHGFGLNGHKRLTVSELGRKLKLTPGAISQRTAKIQGMLDELEDTGIL